MKYGFNQTLRKALLSLMVFLGIGTVLKASDAAQMLRANGKNNAVIAVLAIIFTGLVVYLLRLDRKIRRMEQDQNNK
jgi:CcmD family protein